MACYSLASRHLFWRPCFKNNFKAFKSSSNAKPTHHHFPHHNMGFTQNRWFPSLSSGPLIRSSLMFRSLLSGPRKGRSHQPAGPVWAKRVGPLSADSRPSHWMRQTERHWFWVLFPKEKDLGCRAETRHYRKPCSHINWWNQWDCFTWQHLFMAKSENRYPAHTPKL